MDWVVEFEKLGEEETSKVANNWQKKSIYKVSACAKDLNMKAYIPQSVSFGPYHHEEEELKGHMETHKRRALHHFLKKSGKPLSTYVSALQEVVRSLMDSYENLDVSWNQDRFLQLMLLDGCFMLEILRASDTIAQPKVLYGDYGVDDPIFSYHGKIYAMPYIKRDMLMLENQLPMLLLETLVKVEASVAEGDPVTYLNAKILNFVNPNPKHTIPGEKKVNSLHVLDLYRSSLLGFGLSEQPVTVPLQNGTEDIIRSAEKLHEAGIEFRTSTTTSLMDVSFHNGILKLPTITVDDTTESAFLNLMAFERAQVGAGNEVTSFVSFMDNIIDSARDVSLLHSKGIIHNSVGSEKAVANLFNAISKDVTPDPEGRLAKVHDQLDSYCSRKWNHWFANLKRTYFHNPWAVISLSAAIFLILLTMAQTMYAIISYHHPHDKSS